ncbi:hypothetical protein H4582DRAFT_1560002 [Lactarius indigo]|nr:hypothetical protein H4582DRAFT_1560002 [Lactarius indigo]
MHHSKKSPSISSPSKAVSTQPQVNPVLWGSMVLLYSVGNDAPSFSSGMLMSLKNTKPIRIAFEDGGSINRDSGKTFRDLDGCLFFFRKRPSQTAEQSNTLDRPNQCLEVSVFFFFFLDLGDVSPTLEIWYPSVTRKHCRTALDNSQRNAAEPLIMGHQFLRNRVIP